MKKTARILGYILIVLVIFAFIPVTIPRLFGMQEYNVISGSMEPEIPVGSIVYVLPTNFNELAEGDVIAFESGASVVTHRIVEIDDENMLFTTKGDANDSIDFTPVAYVNVIGKVALHVPFIGIIASFIADLSGKLIAIGIICFGGFLVAFGEEKKAKGENSGTSGSDIDTKTNSKKSAGPNPKLVLAFGLFIIVGALGGFLYIYMGYHAGSQVYGGLNNEYVQVAETEETPWYDMVDVDMDMLTSLYPDVAGWIYVEGTDISYPVMYSGDDETYLRADINKEYLKAGSIFMEGYNLPDWSDSHTIVYGHNMRNLSMFGTLKYYKSEDDYLDDHQYFQIITPTKKMRFEIFSYFDTEAASWVYAVPYQEGEEFDAYISQLLRHSYESIDLENDHKVVSSDKIVTLSTCSTTGMRFTVHGYMCDEVER